MIHNVLLVDKLDGSVVTRTRFWRIDFDDNDIQEFLAGYRDLLDTQGLSKDTPVFVDEHKVFHSLVDDELILLFVTDGRDEDRTIKHKVLEGAARISTALRGNTIGYIRDNLEDILGNLIFTRFKISFVGSGGVGKSTLLRLLFGKDPAPGGYVPTINVAVDSSETVQFGTFLITLWDFAGQAVFQDLWAFYFQGTDVIFLITDSSFRNVMQTKTLMRNIKKEAPAVPLFIIANKQDLPESMAGEKIQRLLGAPTFSMVATDKSRREEFIRLMLEVAAKTVGVELPDRPISEMITVRRKTEDVDLMETKQESAAEAGWETVPVEGEGSTTVTPSSESPSSEVSVTAEAMSTGSTQATEVVTETPDRQRPTEVLHLMLMVQKEGLYDIAYHLNFSEEQLDPHSVVSLISALDSFGGISSQPVSDTGTVKTDALETIEHEGNLVMVEKSVHFVMAIIVTNGTDEETLRSHMTSLLIDIEQRFEDIWTAWDNDVEVIEPSVFDVLTKFPLRPVSLDYIVRAREAGKPLPFASRDVGKAVVEVKTAIDDNATVGGLVRSLDLPRAEVLGALQIMAKFGWVDFKVEIGPESHLRKSGHVDEKTEKTYGKPIVRFVELCDGMKSVEEVVKEVNLVFGKQVMTIQAIKFVATKLVLDGVLEVVV